MNYKIFTEGNDHHFVKALLKEIFGVKFNDLNISYVSTKGWTNIPQNQPQFQETTDAGGKNLVIFDADYDYKGGGFEVRKSDILKQQVNLNINFELFLFPENYDDGDFEILLERIVPINHQPVLKCFNGFEECVQKLNVPNSAHTYNAPIQKSKVFAYIDTVANPKEFEIAKKSGSLCFENSNYWNFQAESLKPLINFIKLHIT